MTVYLLIIIWYIQEEGKSQLADNAILQQVARRNPTEPVYDVENTTPISGGYYYNPGPFQYF